MMKWSVKTETTNIGVLELGNITLDEDYMEISVDICDMSDDLKAELNKAIEIEKVKYSKEWDKWFLQHETRKRFSTKWSEKPVVIEGSSLFITLEAEKPIKYTINTAFHDAENDRLEPVASIDIDLSDYNEELKKEIIHVLIDKFF